MNTSKFLAFEKVKKQKLFYKREKYSKKRYL